MTLITNTSAQAHRPDVITATHEDVLAESLIARVTTVAASGDLGDAQNVRVPFAIDTAAAVVPEGEEIEVDNPELAEVAFNTAKLAVLARVSNEQLYQGGTSSVLTNSVSRSLTRGADDLLLQGNADAGVTGLLDATGVQDGGPLGDSLDTLADALAAIETAGGTAAAIVAHPLDYAELRKLKVSEGANVSLLGAAADDIQPRVLGVPVYRSASARQGTLLVVDPGAVASAVSNATITVDQSRYFEYDASAVRGTIRLGASLVREGRAVTLSIGEDGS